MQPEDVTSLSRRRLVASTLAATKRSPRSNAIKAPRAWLPRHRPATRRVSACQHAWMREPLRIGLVGAGPWAQMFTGPMLASSPDATFVGIWARRPDATRELAHTHGVTTYEDIDALFAACQAVKIGRASCRERVYSSV